MKRFWIERSCLKDQEFRIKDSLYRHICQVCKIKKGEVFELFCEGLQKYTVTLTYISKTQAQAKILETKAVPPLKKPYLHLALSLPRLSKMDSLIEKSVELGLKSLHPFFSEFSFLKKPSKLSSQRERRWTKIIEHSLSQSGRTEPLILHPPQHLKEIQIPKEDLAFMAYEGQRGESLFDLIKKQAPGKAIWLFIGSEGGFSPEEAEFFSKKENGFVGSLGEPILKVETACLFGLSILKYHYHF